MPYSKYCFNVGAGNTGQATVATNQQVPYSNNNNNNNYTTNPQGFNHQHPNQHPSQQQQHPQQQHQIHHQSHIYSSGAPSQQDYLVATTTGCSMAPGGALGVAGGLHPAHDRQPIVNSQHHRQQQQQQQQQQPMHNHNNSSSNNNNNNNNIDPYHTSQTYHQGQATRVMHCNSRLSHNTDYSSAASSSYLYDDISAAKMAANETSNRWRIILSIGLLLPALAAIIAIVAWAISIEVASDSILHPQHPAAPNSNMFMKPMKQQRVAPSSLPLVAPNGTNNRIHDTANSRQHPSQILLNQRNNQNQNDSLNQTSDGVHVLTSAADLNIRLANVAPKELDSSNNNGKTARNKEANGDDNEQHKDGINQDRTINNNNNNNGNMHTINNNNRSDKSQQSGNGGLLAHSVYVVSSPSEPSEQKMESSQEPATSMGATNAEMNEFEAIASAIATTITAATDNGELATESATPDYHSIVEQGMMDAPPADKQQTNTNEPVVIKSAATGQKKSTGEHVAEVIDHIVEQRRIQSQSRYGPLARGPQIVVVAPVGGGAHLMKAQNLLKGTDSNKDTAKKPTNHTVMMGAKTKMLMLDKTTNQSNKQQHNGKPVAVAKFATRSRPLAARLLGPQTTTLSPFELDSGLLNGGKQPIRYSEPVEVINDEDADTIIKSDSLNPIQSVSMLDTSESSQSPVSMANNQPPLMGDSVERRHSLLPANNDHPSQFDRTIHTGTSSLVRSRVPRHESQFGLVKEARSTGNTNNINRYKPLLTYLKNSNQSQNQILNQYHNNQTTMNQEQQQQTPKQQQQQQQQPQPQQQPVRGASVGSAEQMIQEHISRSAQRSQQRPKSVMHQHHQFSSADSQPANSNPNPPIAASASGKREEPTHKLLAPIREDQPAMNEQQQHSIPRPINRQVEETMNQANSNQQTQQQQQQQQQPPPMDSPSDAQTGMSPLHQHQHQFQSVDSPHMQHYLNRQANYAPAQSFEPVVQPHQVVTIEYPNKPPMNSNSNNNNNNLQQVQPQESGPQLPQFADQEYNVPAHMAESVIKDLQNSPSTQESLMYQQQLQQQYPGAAIVPLMTGQQELASLLSSEQKIQMMGHMLRLQEEDIRARMSQGRATNDEIMGLEQRKRALAHHADNLLRRKAHEQSSMGHNAERMMTSASQVEPQIGAPLQGGMFAGKLAGPFSGQQVAPQMVDQSSRQPKIADRMQSASMMSPALALQRVLGGGGGSGSGSVTNSNSAAPVQPQATQRQSPPMGPQSAQQPMVGQESAGPDSGAVGQDQEAQDSYGQMPMYHHQPPPAYGGPAYGGEHYNEPSHDKKSKGITFHFGGGPIGGGSQLITSPMGIFRHLMLPLLPNPRVNLNGKVVFGVVLEKSTAFGEPPKKKSYKFWGR